jgi:hypothetical protein
MAGSFAGEQRKTATTAGTTRNEDVLTADVWHVHKAGSTAPSRWRASLLIQVERIRQIRQGETDVLFRDARVREVTASF